RHQHEKLASVYAYKSQIDAWRRNGHEALDGSTSEERESEPSSSPPNFRRFAKYAGACAAASVIAFWSFMLVTRSAPVAEVRAFNLNQLTNDGQVKYDPLGTDGTRIYTSESLPGQHALLIQVALRGGPPVPIATSLKSPRFFDVSPDGT